MNEYWSLDQINFDLLKNFADENGYKHYGYQEGFKMQKALIQQEGRTKKQVNTQKLRDEGIVFSSKNDGNHLIIIIG